MSKLSGLFQMFCTTRTAILTTLPNVKFDACMVTVFSEDAINLSAFRHYNQFYIPWCSTHPRLGQYVKELAWAPPESAFLLKFWHCCCYYLSVSSNRSSHVLILFGHHELVIILLQILLRSFVNINQLENTPFSFGESSGIWQEGEWSNLTHNLMQTKEAQKKNT